MNPNNPTQTQQTKEFHLGDVLSITAGPLVSPRGMEGVSDILEFMTGDELFNHQLPRARDECAPHLLEQFPQLKEIDASEVDKGNWEKWLNEQIAKYGEKLVVKPIPKGAHQFKDPLSEAAEMMVDPSRVVTLHL